MRSKNLILVAAITLAAHSGMTKADEVATSQADAPSLFKQYRDKAQAATQAALNQATDLLGIRYRRGGTSPENGFDCSGFVGHVFREGIGLVLPRSAAEISKTGESIDRNELKPGDLVFFNTMRRAFSHVGIYLGNNQFIHAPRVGGQIRIEDMRESYWANRYNGARRVADDNNQ